MAAPVSPLEPDTQNWQSQLIGHNFLFRGFDLTALNAALNLDQLSPQRFFSNRTIFTAFQVNHPLKVLYIALSGGPITVRSAPLDRVITITYPGSCFGMRNLPLAHGSITRMFPSVVEAYKTTTVLGIPIEGIHSLYHSHEVFQQRYDMLFELREKFQYHLLNCSSYPPQAVASILEALVYQEGSLGNQPGSDGFYTFDLSVDLIARASQLNQRTVEQVLKGLRQAKVIQTSQDAELGEDEIRVIDPDQLSEVYSSTRSKVDWWPLKT
ncbi:MAG: Crp/Fnr family transcriptional regulator [Synechococcaceae cyanobacterium SM2_3_2]|nr:Crp/Fnr family transcriptional regulator [Synechococcaceae cyanobacterium SM2_3_2]